MIVNIIRMIHLIIIILVAISPIIDNNIIKKYAFIFLVYLLFQYITGYKQCGLTKFEYIIMQDKHEEGFLYRLINPMITVREDYFENYLLIIHICIIVLLFIQLYDINDIIGYLN